MTMFPPCFSMDDSLPLFSLEVTMRTAILAWGRTMTIFSVMVRLAWLSVMLEVLAQPARASCESAEEGDECIPSLADLRAGCTSRDPIVPGECLLRFGVLRCISRDNRDFNGEDCGALEQTCVCLSGTCIEEDLAGFCVEPAVVIGDPHLVGFSGQKFDFTGEDQGSYNLVHDGECNVINMRVTSLPGTPVVTYITALGLRLCGDSGTRHTVEIEVNDPHKLDSHCPSEAPCLADGAITVRLDGEEFGQPGEYSTGDGVYLGAVNIPGECRPFGFEKYWLRKQEEYARQKSGRRLRLAEPMFAWVLSDSRRTNPIDCQLYVDKAVEESSLFEHQSEHTSFQITSPSLSLRVNHGKIHQLAMRDPTDTFDLPDHIAFQMNLVFEKIAISDDPRGVIGETTHPVVDEAGNPVMSGLQAIRGGEEDYRVDCLLCEDFAQLHWE